jgi:RNase P subunit RPR2
MTTNCETQQEKCADCGWPLAQPVEVVSRHATSTGTVVYGRCACGTLHMTFWGHGPSSGGNGGSGAGPSLATGGI